MRKRIRLAALLTALALLLTGCWNYRGLNEITIVSGFSIDRDPASGMFKICFETVDLSGDVKTEGPKAMLLESEGMTLFEAARNAKRRLSNKLYFGNAQVVIVSHEVAATDGIDPLIDWFLRDAEGRETVYVVISQEETARDILTTEGIDDALVSFEIASIIGEDEMIVSSTGGMELFQIYNILRGQGISLTLPAFHTVLNSGKRTCESNGIAVFEGHKLLGYLTPGESRYFLFAIGGVHGGIVALPRVEGVAEGVSLEISRSLTKRSFKVEDGRLCFSLDIDLRAYLAEVGSIFNAQDKELIARLETAAAEMIREKTREIIQKVQTEFRSDIFGFGKTIYQKNPALWKQVSEAWTDWFAQLQVEVTCKVKIINSAYLYQS